LRTTRKISKEYNFLANLLLHYLKVLLYFPSYRTGYVIVAVLSSHSEGGWVFQVAWGPLRK